MSSLLTGNHRSSSDRLLNNYLSSQKQLSTALLTLLSHSHSSSSSLLAYVTSSPGVPNSVRRAVQHSAFEGAVSSSSPYGGFGGFDEEASRWNAYIAGLENFRKDLKEVHGMEEELSQVKRDREILITRLIKATKARPSKSDLAAAAAASHQHSSSRMSSSGSVLSFGSDGSGTTAGGTGRGKRAAKLAEAQAEVLGCEEHLRGLEVQLENERSRVMRHGLMERFKAMEDVGRMWTRQAKLGMAELEKTAGDRGPDGNLYSNAYEVGSNDGSIAPSQSASQVGHQDLRQSFEHPVPSPAKPVNRRVDRHIGGVNGTGSVTGSIAEEDEGSSGSDDGESGLVVHENHPRVGGGGGSQQRVVPAGVPSITAIKPIAPRRNVSDSSAGSGAPAGGRRRTQSEVGMGYNPPTAHKRANLRRTMSGGGSDGSSIQQAKKKGGFFRAIARLFKSNPREAPARGSVRGGSIRNGSVRGGRRGDESPPLVARSRGGWQTRTDQNVKMVGASRGRSGDSSDSEDDGLQSRGLVAVTNVGGNKWSVDKVGVIPTTAGSKRTSKSDLGSKAKSDAGSTIVASNKLPKAKPPAAATTTSPPAATTGSVSRSGTVKSTASKRTRQGSITRTAGARTSGSAAAGPSISSVIEKADKPVAAKAASASGTITKKDDVPKMMEIPKAPKSQVTPQMYQATAPPPASESLLKSPPPLPAATPAPVKASSRPSSMVSVPKASASANGNGIALGAPVAQSSDEEDRPERPASPLPPSRTLSPPVKSALRPTSPVPGAAPAAPPAPAPAPGYLVTAPSSVIPEKAVEKATVEPVAFPAPVVVEAPKEIPTIVRPPTNNRDSYATAMTTDEESVYESAAEEGNDSEDETRGTPAVVPSTHTPVVQNLLAKTVDEDSESEASDSTAGATTKYKVVDNNRGIPTVPIEAAGGDETPPASTVAPQAAAPVVATPKVVQKPDSLVPPAEKSEGGLERRKSVRMNVPDSPAPGTDATLQAAQNLPTRNPTTASAPVANGNGNAAAAPATEWKSKVGRAVESSDEEDNAAYAKAKKSLTTSQKRFSGLGEVMPKTVGTTTKKKSSSKRRSVA